ncbi:uncharacterized protein METZ01_LOCUS490503, partial [marine metagenome]
IRYPDEKSGCHICYPMAILSDWGR